MSTTPGSGAPFARIAWGFAAVAALASAAVPLPPAVALAAVACALVAPGAWLAARAASDWPAAPRAAFALALSPVLVAVPFSVLVVAGLPVTPAARAVLAMAGMLALIEATRGTRIADSGAAPGAPPAADVLPALAFAAVIAALLAGNAWLPLRSDGWFHVGVVRQIAERGLPPEDPYFAGVPLLYFWGVHAWAGALTAAQPGLDPAAPLVAFNVAAAAAVLLAVAGAVRALGGGDRASVLAAALAVFGYAPGAWGWIVGRAFRGDVTGFGEVRDVIALGADPVLATLARGLLHASLAFFGDKFLVLTPFSMGLALFALAAIAMGEVAAQRPRATPRLFVLTAAALWTHAVVGNALVLLSVTVGLLSVLFAPRDRSAWAAAGRVVAAALGAALLLAPYLLAITAGKHGQLGARLWREAVTSLLWGGALVVPAALLWLSGRARRGRLEFAWLAAAAPLVALSLALKLPENNQSKFLNLLLLLLAAPAAMGWLAFADRLGRAGRWTLAAGGAVLALPTAALALWAFAAERGRSAGSWHEPDAATHAGLDWARAHTHSDAAFVDLHGAADLIAIAGRSVVWGGRRGERDWGFDPAALQSRRIAAQALALGQSPGERERATLVSLGRDIVVTARAADSSDARSGWNVLPRARGFHEVHRTPSVAFFRWEAGR